MIIDDPFRYEDNLVVIFVIIDDNNNLLFLVTVLLNTIFKSCAILDYWINTLHRKKKVPEFPVSSRDVTNQTPPWQD